MNLARQSAAVLALALATLPVCAQRLPTPDPTPQKPAAKSTAPPAPALEEDDQPAPIVRKTPKPAPIVLKPASGATGSTGRISVPQTARPAGAAAAATGSTGAHTAAKPAMAAPIVLHPAPKPASPAPSAAANAAPAAPAGPPTGALNRGVIVLDPSHGGIDSGSRIGDSILEKEVTLQLAFKLRSLLSARGFNVVMTRDSDAAMQPNSPAAPLTLDDRAGIANHQRAVACLLLHATGSGGGVHLYSSELDPAPAEVATLPWLTAQAAWVAQSLRLERQISNAVNRSKISLVSSSASIRPVDSLTCPAVVIELAPNGDDPGSINDDGYQQRVAAAIADAMVFWRNLAQPPVKILPPPPPPRVVAPVAPAPDTEAP